MTFPCGVVGKYVFVLIIKILSRNITKDSLPKSLSKKRNNISLVYLFNGIFQPFLMWEFDSFVLSDWDPNNTSSVLLHLKFLFYLTMNICLLFYGFNIWFKQRVKSSRVILCWEVCKSLSSNVLIYIFVYLYLRTFFWFIVLLNTNTFKPMYFTHKLGPLTSNTALALRETRSKTMKG